uniref:CCHC-type domain-containing protein n=1 Tax=Lactuca sativa TaxID=4236 RepID=A0A9R1XVD5_LACSA|nr:hypothetical protein LSAT_V11C200078270 [Lactuca sativa]
MPRHSNIFSFHTVYSYSSKLNQSHYRQYNHFPKRERSTRLIPGSQQEKKMKASSKVAKYKDAQDVWDPIKIRKDNAIVEKFKSFGSSLDEEVIVRKFLNFVPKKYLPIVASIEQYSDLESMPLKEAVGRIKAYEDILKSHDEKEEEQGQLLLTSSKSSEHEDNQWGRGRGRGRGFGRGERGRGRGSGRGDKSGFRCYECGKHGLFANECTKWKDKEK